MRSGDFYETVQYKATLNVVDRISYLQLEQNQRFAHCQKASSDRHNKSNFLYFKPFFQIQ